MSSLGARVRRVAPVFREGRTAIAIALLASVLSAASEPMVPAILKRLLDSGFTDGTLPIWWVPAALIGLFALRGVAGFVTEYGLTWAASRGVIGLRERMFGHLLQAQPQLFTGQSASKLSNTIVYEVQTGSQMLVNSLLTLTRDALTLVALLGYLLWINWKLTLFVAVLFPVLLWVLRVLSRRLHRLTVASQGATDELAYVVEENALAWRAVRLHGAQPVQGTRFRRAAEAVRGLVMKSTVATSSLTPVTQMLTAVALSSVLSLALWQSRNDASTVGSFVAFITAMLMLISPMKHLSTVMAPITRGLASLERALDLIDDIPAESSGAHHAAGAARGQVELQGVSVRFAADQAPALQDITLSLHAGETVALVGPSGAGKSTLANLLPRFAEPTAGRVTLDGVALPDWSLADLRRNIALVSQEVVLFNASVAANVALGEDAQAGRDDARIEQALRDANLDAFVHELPQGLDTPIGHNGATLSGGQRQRLAIARALYKDAPVLILDEATSALDSQSERQVQTALERLMKGRTTLVIAHRLSTIEHADRVVVLEAGRIAEQGTHRELLARGGLYARLHALQFGGNGHGPATAGGIDALTAEDTAPAAAGPVGDGASAATALADRTPAALVPTAAAPAPATASSSTSHLPRS